jgi:hypothetical protein
MLEVNPSKRADSPEVVKFFDSVLEDDPGGGCLSQDFNGDGWSVSAEVFESIPKSRCVFGHANFRHPTLKLRPPDKYHSANDALVLPKKRARPTDSAAGSMAPYMRDCKKVKLKPPDSYQPQSFEHSLSWPDFMDTG